MGRKYIITVDAVNERPIMLNKYLFLQYVFDGNNLTVLSEYGGIYIPANVGDIFEMEIIDNRLVSTKK